MYLRSREWILMLTLLPKNFAASSLRIVFLFIQYTSPVCIVLIVLLCTFFFSIINEAYITDSQLFWLLNRKL